MAIRQNYNKREYLISIMKYLNFLIIFYISMILFWCTNGFLNEGSSREVLTKIGPIFCAYWKIPVLAVVLYLMVIVMMDIKNTDRRFIFFKILFELVISYLISRLLNFNYSGIFLLISADIISYFKKTKVKFILVAAMFLIYLMLNIDIVNLYYHVASLDAYLSYFQSDTRTLILGGLNFLSSLNIFVFLIYLVLVAIDETIEKENVIQLNNTLNSLNKQLKMANVRLDEYAKQSQEMAKTQERNRLAREIHDTLGHTLTGIISGLDACSVLIDAAPQVAKKQIQTISDVARKGMIDVRRSVKALRPDALEQFQLSEAIENCINETKDVSGCEVNYHLDADLNVFNESEQETIYRIVQESLTNSIRHGHATKIDISIVKTNQFLSIDIRDNGVGAKNLKKGFGLHHMEERLKLLKGSVEYNGDKGFVLNVRIPIRNRGNS